LPRFASLAAPAPRYPCAMDAGLAVEAPIGHMLLLHAYTGHDSLVTVLWPSARSRVAALATASSPFRSRGPRGLERGCDRPREARCPRQGRSTPPPRLTSRPLVFAAVLQRVVGVDDVASSSVHLGPGGVVPPDLERQKRAIARSATRHADHPVAERRVVPHRGLGSRELEPSSTRLATGARLITNPSQLQPVSAARAVEVGAIAQRQPGAAACFARPPEPPAMPAGLVENVRSSLGSSDLERRSWAGGSLLATQRGWHAVSRCGMTTATRMPQPDRSMPAQRPATMLIRSTQFLHPVRWGRYPITGRSNARRCA
jgi:hypothetical protein